MPHSLSKPFVPNPLHLPHSPNLFPDDMLSSLSCYLLDLTSYHSSFRSFLSHHIPRCVCLRAFALPVLCLKPFLTQLIPYLPSVLGSNVTFSQMPSLTAIFKIIYLPHIGILSLSSLSYFSPVALNTI